MGRVSRQGDRKWGGRGALPACSMMTRAVGTPGAQGEGASGSPQETLLGPLCTLAQRSCACSGLAGPVSADPDGVGVALLGAGACRRVDPHPRFHTAGVLSAVLRAAELKAAAQGRTPASAFCFLPLSHPRARASPDLGFHWETERPSGRGLRLRGLTAVTHSSCNAPQLREPAQLCITKSPPSLPFCGRCHRRPTTELPKRIALSHTGERRHTELRTTGRSRWMLCLYTGVVRGQCVCCRNCTGMRKI